MINHINISNNIVAKVALSVFYFTSDRCYFFTYCPYNSKKNKLNNLSAIQVICYNCWSPISGYIASYSLYVCTTIFLLVTSQFIILLFNL